jgi:RNA polymerase sigma-70 factor (ECF subfamily)
MEDSDAAVVERVRRGDIDAFGELVERHSLAVFRLAYRMTGNEQDAEDLVQETFARAYRHLNGFDTGASFGAWVHRIAVNCSISLLRRRQRQPKAWRLGQSEWGEALDSLPVSAPAPDREAFNAEVRQRVQSVLEGLSPRERAAFVLRHFEGKSIEEIALALGLRAGAAKQTIFRAVQKARRGLESLLSPT